MITPEQLRNHARFELPLTKKSLQEIADRLDAADKLHKRPLIRLLVWLGVVGKVQRLSETQ